MLVRDRSDHSTDIRVGYTVTKKIGNAVIRNRLKRRYRALAQLTLGNETLKGRDIVMIGRQKGLTRLFKHMQLDVDKALGT